MSLVLNNVSARVEDDVPLSLTAIELELPRGAVTVVVGPGGSGKSLLLDVLAGVVPIDEGEISCQGDRDPRIVYQAVRPLLPREHTVEGFFALLGLETPARFGLKRRAASPLELLPPRLRRALWLMAALSRPAEVYLFDDPTLGFDRNFVDEFVALVAERSAAGATVVLATVDLALASRITDFVVVLEHGRVSVSGTVEQLKENVPGAETTAALLEQLWPAGGAL